MKGFVDVKQVSLWDELKKLLEKLANEESYYFVRSPHAVSGIQMKLPEQFPPYFEGQMFNSEREIRWKKQGNSYEILLLSRVEIEPNLGFQPIYNEPEEIEWEVCDRHAYFYDIDETKFPKSFIFKDINNQDIDPKTIPIRQRYFHEKKTATVHFVALTVKK